MTRQPAHSYHPRVSGGSRDEVEIVLVEGAFKIRFTGPSQDPLVDLAHFVPECGRLVHGRRCVQLLPHLLDRAPRLGGQQLRSRTVLVKIADNVEVTVLAGSAEGLVIARAQLATILV